MKVFCVISVFFIFLASSTILECSEAFTRKVFDRVPIFSKDDAISIIRGSYKQCKILCQSEKSFATAPSHSQYDHDWCVCMSEEDPFSHGLVNITGATLYETVENQVGLSQFLYIDTMPVGGFMYSEKPMSLKQCALSCVSATQSRNGCQAFEYSVISKECNLYAESHIQNGTTMRRRIGDDEPTMYFEYMNFLLRSYSAQWPRFLNGSSLNFTTKMNANECAAECCRRPRCDGFNYDSNEMKCEMFNASQETTQSNRNVISFQKRTAGNDRKFDPSVKLKESVETKRAEGAKKETKKIDLNSINATFTANYTDIQTEPRLIILQIRNTDANGRLSIQLSHVQLGMDSEEHCTTGVLNIQAGWRSNFSFCNYKSNKSDIITAASEAEIMISVYNISTHSSFASLQQNVYLKVSAIAGVEMNVTEVEKDGVIQSPNINGSYPPNLDHKWIVQANNGMIPVLELLSFKLAQFQFAEITSCDNDRFYLDYGNASNPLCGHLGKDNLPKQLISPFKSFTLLFKTDDRYEDAGFEIMVNMFKEFPCATKGMTPVTTSGVLFQLLVNRESQNCDWLLKHSFNVTIKFCKRFCVKSTVNGNFECYNCSSTRYLILKENSIVRWNNRRDDNWFVAFVNETEVVPTSSQRPTGTTHSVPSISSTSIPHVATTTSRHELSTSTSASASTSTSVPHPATSTPSQSSTGKIVTTSTITVSTSSMSNTTVVPSHENKPLIIGLSVAAFIILVAVAITAIYIFKFRRQNRDRTLSQQVLPNSTLEINVNDYLSDAFEAPAADEK